MIEDEAINDDKGLEFAEYADDFTKIKPQNMTVKALKAYHCLNIHEQSPSNTCTGIIEATCKGTHLV